jgi:hypothetical protein
VHGLDDDVITVNFPLWLHRWLGIAKVTKVNAVTMVTKVAWGFFTQSSL